MIRKINNLIFILSVKVVRRLQANTAFKSDDTLVQGAMTMHYFILSYLIFTILFPVTKFGFNMDKNGMILTIMSGIILVVVHSYFTLIKGDKWKAIEQNIDKSMTIARRDRFFGIFSIAFIAYYSITLLAFGISGCL